LKVIPLWQTYSNFPQRVCIHRGQTGQDRLISIFNYFFKLQDAVSFSDCFKDGVRIRLDGAVLLRATRHNDREGADAPDGIDVQKLQC
jgi:hypothetical protein